MRRAKLVDTGTIILEDVETPKPKSSEVLLNVKLCGICGSDIHAYHGKHPFIHPPIVPGHEFSAIVHETGSDVEEIKQGQRVVVEPLISCGRCYNCRIARYNQCAELKVIGCTTNGALSEFFVAPANRVLLLPEGFPLNVGALVEPTAVAVHAVKRGNVQGGNRIVVLGSGPIGLLTALAAKAFGATEVIITDIYDSRLEIAKNCGVDHAVDVSETDPVQYVHHKFGDDGADVVFECVGSKETLDQAIRMARKGTKIVVVGVFSEEIPVKMAYVQDREIELIGSLTYVGRDFLDTINLIHAGKIDPRPLVTKVFPLEKVSDAYKFIDENKASCLKILVEVSK